MAEPVRRAQPVQLNDIEAFREVLRDYHVSPHAQKVLDESRLVVLSGVAGGGRNTVINYLVEQHNYFFIVSDTTRPPKLRDGIMERDGVNYYFRSEADMLRDIQAGEFVEAEIIHNQQVSGTSIRELERANESGRISIIEAEFGGVHNIATSKPDAFVIGLLPPSYAEWIRRFQGREAIHEQEFKNRLQTAEKVLGNMLREPYFKFVINRTVEQCAADIRAIVEDDNYDDSHKQAGREVAQEILDRVKLKLTKY